MKPKLRLGKNMLKNSAANCKKLLEERYKDSNKVSKSDINASIEYYYSKDEEDKKKKVNGNATAAKDQPSASDPKK